MTTAHRVMPCLRSTRRASVASCAAVLLLALPVSAQDDVEPPSVSHEEMKTGRIGEPVVVSATISDPSGVFDPAVLYRVGGEGEFLRLPMQESESGSYQAVIPGDVVSGDLEYFIEAFDQRGNGPARYADADLPVKVRVLKTAEPLPSANGDGAVAAAEEGSGGGTLWVIAAVVGVGLVLAAAAAAGVGAFILLSPPPVPAQVDVVIGAPTPVAAGLSP